MLFLGRSLGDSVTKTDVIPRGWQKQISYLANRVFASDVHWLREAVEVMKTVSTLSLHTLFIILVVSQRSYSKHF